MTSKQNDPFTQAYKILNSQQKKAVDTIEGPVMVVAGPGTGKTQILTLRIANILTKTQVNPENILALTFTDSGVLAMRKRLVDIIGTPGYRVEIHTFHGFCNEIIKRNPDDFEQFLAANSITEIEQIQVLENILDKQKLEFLKPINEPYFYLRAILSGINDLKKEGITPETFEEVLKTQQADFDKIEDLYNEKGAYKGIMKGKYQDLQKQINKNLELQKVYKEYQKSLREQKMYDFNDMLLEVVTTLQQNKDLLLRLQETYQYILVDEHQDTNSAQNKLIELLCSFFPNPNLFVVGDEKQAIFRFQGASLENFLYFKKLYPTATLINLEENYRSQQTILDASGSLIKQNVSSQLLEQVLELKAKTNHPLQKIQVAALSDYFAESHFITKDIKEKIAGGIPAKEITILGRNNKDLLEVANVLQQYQIPFIIESDQNIFADADVRKLILLLKAIGNFGSEIDLVPVLHIDFLKIDPLDIYKLIHFAGTQKISLYEVLITQEKLSQVGLANKESLTKLLEKLTSWSRLSVNENLTKLFVDVVNESGLREAILSKPNSLEILDKVTGLYEEIKLQTDKNPLFRLKDFLNYLDLLQTHELLIKKRVKTILKNSVRLMTAHKSKGLEFDWVYIINAFDGHWGNSKKRPQLIKLPWNYLGVKLQVDFDEIEDERRLFYVCLTRARKGVIISYSLLGLEGKEQIPTQFVDEIAEEFKERLNVQAFETEFLNHKEIIFKPSIHIGQDIQSKEFIRELFLERGLSATALNNYLECPWKYFYKNLLQLPDHKSPNMVYGSAIHQTLNTYIQALKKRQQPNAQFLVETFDKYLSKQLGKGEDYERFLEKGKKTLKVYFDQKASKWKENLIGEMQIKGVQLTDDVILNGRIDMIEPTANTSEVLVYDFKTGNVKSRNVIEGLTANSEGNLKRQLIFYKLLLDKYHLGKYKMKEGIIDFVEPDAKEKLHQQSFIIEDTEVKALEEQLKFVASQILNLEFWELGCKQKGCEYCALREVMQQKLTSLQ